MRIVTCNVNGLRSADRKGFTTWMLKQKPDVVCMQEIKAQESDLTRELLAPKGLHGFFHPAQKKGCPGWKRCENAVASSSSAATGTSRTRKST